MDRPSCSPILTMLDKNYRLDNRKNLSYILKQKLDREELEYFRDVSISDHIIDEYWDSEQIASDNLLDLISKSKLTNKSLRFLIYMGYYNDINKWNVSAVTNMKYLFFVFQNSWYSEFKYEY